MAPGQAAPRSRARVWTFDKDETVDLDFFIRRLKYAQESAIPLIKRRGLTGYRLCAAESDGLPGLTIDRLRRFSGVPDSLPVPGSSVS